MMKEERRNMLLFFCFVDTPGYNNSDKANASNGKTDKATAQEAMKEGNVLLWLVDIERGTITTDDIKMIKEFKGKKVFIFNKADKKSMSDCQYIVEAAARIILQSFTSDEVIDILAYTTRDNKICFSHNGFSQIETVIAKCKTAGNGESNIERYKKEVRDLFDVEIVESRKAIAECEEEYKEEVDKKSELGKKLMDCKNNDFQIVESLKDILIDRYSEQIKARDEFFPLISKVPSDYSFFFCDPSYDNGLGFFRHHRLVNVLNIVNKYKTTVEYNDSSLEHRESLLDRVKWYEDFYLSDLELDRDSAREACANTLEDIKSEQAIIDSMRAYQDIFCDALENAINTYRSKKRVVSVQNDNVEASNIFETIKKNDYTSFLHSFEEGVDMWLCNVDGYNPMTLAVKMGNAQMVKFMLDHNADPNLKDNRGYNAFHTAVENQYRNICELLLDEDPDLVDTETSKGESAEDIMEKNTFNKWLKSKI